MRLIRHGDEGPEIHDIRRRLAAAGHACADDPAGVFGDATEAVVRAFQQRRGLTADGIVGPDTWRALVEAGYGLGDRLLYLRRPPLRGDDVRQLQRRLNQLGFDTGSVDGAYGGRTASAVREFQLNVGLRVDGIAGPAVLEALARLHREHQWAAAAAVREREALRRAARTSLAGARLLIDPGHGPEDPGYLAVNGRAEHELVWEIGSRLAGRLGARSAHVVLSRGPHTTPSASERARLANVEDVEAILSVHLNGLASRRARGVAAYYFGDDTYVSDAGLLLATFAVEAVVGRTGTANCRIHPGTMALLRESRAPAVIVEVGFITHPEEGWALQDPEYQDLLADALTDALTAYLTRVPAPA